jgi:hypothetical protein
MTAEDLNHWILPLSRVLDYRDPGEVQRTPDKLSPLTTISTRRPIRRSARSMRKSPS